MKTTTHFFKACLFGLLFLFSAILQANERFITTSDGVKLYVKIAGQGTPLLYIHGGPGSGSYWFEQFFGDFMEQNFQVIYLDQRGVGRSSSPQTEDYSLERMLLDFEEIRMELGIENWLSLGHSFGGILQSAYATQYPKANLGLLMINCTLNLNKSFCESWSPKAAEFLDENIPGCENDTLPLMGRMGQHIEKLREKDLFWKMAYKYQENDSILNATYNDIPNWNSSFSSRALNIDDYWKDFSLDTPKITIPVLFFYGTQDWMVGPHHYEIIDFPEMILWKSDGGHIPFLEDKAELARAIETFKLKYHF
ncbi:alpha/beta fold hydrolase [Salegentibacter sp. HM20]